MVSARSGAGEPASDWEIASSSLAERPTRWGSLTWVSARPLIASLNHVLSLRARGLVTRLRQGWTPDGDKVVELPDARGPATTFILIGDTGEQDASQYVVAPALSRAAQAHHPDFVLIMSDVIYPSGDVNDYPDGVYRPYRGDDKHFRVDAPILGLPGNHDWYDGLNGFMYHFVRRDQPHEAAYAPDAAYAPLTGDRSPLSRLCRILWRRASAPDQRTAAERARSPLTQALDQPGPYYAVQTPDLLVVCIDTGIDGTIDEEQGAWLREVSQRPGAKILATGKPLVVDEEIHPCAITDTPEAGAEPAPGDTVWEIVNIPEYGYLATVGGDVHNFQQYRGLVGTGGPRLHLVSGGGGAFLHATHTLANAPNDSRLRARPGRQYYGPPEQTFPTRGESLALFASLLVPTVRRVICYLMVLLAGALAGLLPILVAGPRRGESPLAPAILAAPAILGAALLAVVLVVSALLPPGAVPRTSRAARARTVAIMAAIGLLITGATGLLVPGQVVLVAVFAAVVAALHLVVSWLLRRSGWWRPADESARTQSPLAFAAGLAGLTALVAAAQLLLGWSAVPGMAIAAAVLSGLSIVGVGGYGWRRRGRLLTVPGPAGTWVDGRQRLRRGPDANPTLLAELGSRNRAWHRKGLVVAWAVQAVCLLLAVVQLLVVTGTAPSPEVAAVLVLRVVVGLPCLALVLVLVVAGVLLGATAGRAASRGRRHGQDPGTAWGAAARWTHGLLVPVLVAGLALLLAAITALGPGLPGGLSPALRAAIAPLTCVVVLVVALLLVDAARRRHPAGYLWFVVLGAALLALLGSALFAWPTSRWIVTTTAGAAAVLVALGVIILLGHLSFLGAFWVIVDRGAPTFTEAELDELFRARAAYPPQTPRVPARVLRWARLTSPALGEPGGILQREVSEIFSSDEPPFFKGFLRLSTRRVGNGATNGQAELSIVLHRVYGDRPAQQEEIAVIPFATGDVTLGQQID